MSGECMFCGSTEKLFLRVVCEPCKATFKGPDFYCAHGIHSDDRCEDCAIERAEKRADSYFEGYAED